MAQFGMGFGKDETLPDDEVSRRFAARHRLGFWMALLPCLLFAGTAFINGRVWPVFAAAGCIVVALGYVRFVYRCPLRDYAQQRRNRDHGHLVLPEEMQKVRCSVAASAPLGAGLMPATTRPSGRIHE